MCVNVSLPSQPFYDATPGCACLSYCQQEMEAAERLRVTRTGLEVNNEKLEAELEETKQRLRAALSAPVPKGADSKTWRASVVTRSANCFLIYFFFKSVKIVREQGFRAN